MYDITYHIFLHLDRGTPTYTNLAPHVAAKVLTHICNLSFGDSPGSLLPMAEPWHVRLTFPAAGMFKVGATCSNAPSLGGTWAHESQQVSSVIRVLCFMLLVYPSGSYYLESFFSCS